MLPGAVVILAALQTLGLMTAVYSPPMTTVEQYSVRVEAVGQVLDFTQPPGSRRLTKVVVSVAGEPEALARLLEVAQDPKARDDEGNFLAFQQIRYPPGSTYIDETGVVKKLRFEVWFAGGDPEAKKLEEFSSALVCFEKKENLRLDFVSVAGEKPAKQNYEGLSVEPSFAVKKEAGKEIFEVKMEIVYPAEEEKETATEWGSEQVELIDAGGKVQPALSSSCTYKYDKEGRIFAKTITAKFAQPSQAPRGVRYRVERLTGVKRLSYEFEGLPLP